MRDFSSFLVDHAAAEKKASGMAISMLSHYPDRADLVAAMIDLAIEEMTHFREVVAIIHQRGLKLGSDNKDPYVNQLRKFFRQGSDHYLLDRLVVASIIETRGCERFALIAEALQDNAMKKFYRAITQSEARHSDLFLKLATRYFDSNTIQARLHELLNAEADIVANLPIRAALH